ncbi:MAG: FAD-dependent oxidoreductase [Candidatus Diapherotrites archaeon]|nr:FAD-dependent oxidoreductase [Candidatus Diapherotrites archaeon]
MPNNEPVDVAIVGAGPAGMTAALFAVRKALSVRIFESNALGGQTAEAVFVENYTGMPKMPGSKLAQKMAEHLRGFGVEVEEAAEVTGIKKIEKKGGGKGKEPVFELEINNCEEKVLACTVIICTGSKYKTLGVPGEKEFYGNGVSYCATCDGLSYKGKTVAVVGAGNSGANAALFLAEICKKTYLVEFMPKPTCDAVCEVPVRKVGVELLLNTQLLEISGKKTVEKIRIKDRGSGREKEIAVDSVFIYVGMLPRNALAKSLGLKLDSHGYIEVDRKCMSSVPGVFAAGDINGELAQTVVAAGSGAVAATAAFEYLMRLE